MIIDYKKEEVTGRFPPDVELCIMSKIIDATIREHNGESSDPLSRIGKDNNAFDTIYEW